MNKTTLNSQKEKHSMLSLRRATFVGLAAHRLRNISIHALLAESDISQLQCILGGKYFYPRSPCGERLQSECPFAEAVPDFYPRSPCGERRSAHRYSRQCDAISIHALLAESDLLHI